MRDFNLEQYLSNGVRDIVTQALKATLTNPRETAFLTKFSLAMKRAQKIRDDHEARDEHIPPFLIASITSACNLHCAGCYARANHACGDTAPVEQMTAADWGRIFSEARDLGIGFILLAGGEPTIRRDVMETAAGYPEILFPIFTNGTMLDDSYLDLMDRSRNLVPVVSIEGHRATTDLRRGEGVYDAAASAMEKMKERRLVFGTSVTQTTQNLEEITSDSFIETLQRTGAKVVFFIEFVPVTKGTEFLAPDQRDREKLQARLAEIREQYPDMLFIAFPGDEQASGGCLAAGRGFFHINSRGGAEPCPFSPYSDISVKDTSLREALTSPLFTALRTGSALLDDHPGGCVLYEKRELVEALIRQGRTAAAG